MNNINYNTKICPTPTQWLCYKRGMCTPEEVHAIEIHFSECPLCSVAIEHIMITDADTLEKEWQLLEKKETKIVPLPKPKSTPFRHLSQLGIAAATLICIGGAYVLYEQNRKNQAKPIAQQTPSSTLEQISPSNKSVSPPPAIQNKPAPVSVDAVTTIKSVSPKAESRLDESNQNRLMTSEQETAVAGVESFKEKDMAETPMVEKSAQTDAVVTTLATAPPANASAFSPTEQTASNKALKTSGKENFSGARDNLSSFNVETKKTAKKDNISKKSIVEQAAEKYLNKEYVRAIPLLESALQLEPNNETIAFYLADAYLKTGKKSKAKKSLEKIVAKNGSYAKQAQQMLDLLQE